MKRVSLILVVVAFAAWPAESDAYETYSQNRNSGNCATCHGNYMAANYVSLHDGAAWSTDLMSGHNTMVANDCGACHKSSFFPVELAESLGARGLSTTSCVACHGRDQDAGHDGISEGRGAGLRQHHHRAGLQICAGCHSDANPANYTPVAENVAPVNYFAPDAVHPNKPTDPCDANGSESVYGSAGLDNDGNLAYDLADSACAIAATPTPTATSTATPPKPTATATSIPATPTRTSTVPVSPTRTATSPPAATSTATQIPATPTATVPVGASPTETATSPPAATGTATQVPTTRTPTSPPPASPTATAQQPPPGTTVIRRSDCAIAPGDGGTGYQWMTLVAALVALTRTRRRRN